MTGIRLIAAALLALATSMGGALAQDSGAADGSAEGGLSSSIRPRTRTSDEAFVASMLSEAEAQSPQDEAASPPPAETAPAAAATPSPAPAPAPSPAPSKIARDPSKGTVTNLPIPRYVSLKGNEGNARRGPSLGHRIDWVFTTSGMPLRVTAEHENWRRVEDAEGMGGWVHYALLSGVRSALVIADTADFHVAPDAGSGTVFRAERGVIGRLLACELTWCRLNVQGEKGWVEKTALWGVDPGEILE